MTGNKTSAELCMPSITEVAKGHSLHCLRRSKDDLLAFQYTHFGDNSKPENWFIDAQTALNVKSEAQEEEEEQEDDLGYYEDGVKRTLTDDQIAMFRHSEIQDLLRERRLRREEEEYQARDPEAESSHAPASPRSDASSIEADLLEFANPKTRQPERRQPPPLKRQPSHSSKSDTSRSSGKARQRRRQEVPYDQRKKRKWEQHIEDQDPMEGSRTHRRIVRELDDQATETLDIDYG